MRPIDAWPILEKMLTEMYAEYEADLVIHTVSEWERLYRGFRKRDFFGPAIRMTEQRLMGWSLSFEIMEAEIELWLRSLRRRIDAWVEIQKSL